MWALREMKKLIYWEKTHKKEHIDIEIKVISKSEGKNLVWKR